MVATFVLFGAILSTAFVLKAGAWVGSADTLLMGRYLIIVWGPCSMDGHKAAYRYTKFRFPRACLARCFCITGFRPCSSGSVASGSVAFLRTCCNRVERLQVIDYPLETGSRGPVELYPCPPPLDILRKLKHHAKLWISIVRLVEG